MAYISGMCQSQRRCSIAEDTGLDVASTIAHELGHKYVDYYLESVLRMWDSAIHTIV